VEKTEDDVQVGKKKVKKNIGRKKIGKDNPHTQQIPEKEKK